MADIGKEYVNLARLALSGSGADIVASAKRGLAYLLRQRPELSASITELLKRMDATPTRGAATFPVPIDAESKLELLRHEQVVSIEPEPSWPVDVMRELQVIVAERQRERDLLAHGIAPSKSLLFVGAPGVGKTLAARWVAMHLDRPLLTLDLAAVMSSYLGKTGNNIRAVLEYAQSIPSVLLLDEFDAIAKRRDDGSDVGELKRLVNVLLQAVDDWPATGVLIAATNHPELLDPAVWRRFDRIVTFPLPATPDINDLLGRIDSSMLSDAALREILAETLAGCSFADVVRYVHTARRNAIVYGLPDEDAMLSVISHRLRELDSKQRINLALRLRGSGHSARRISDLTGVSRDTIRKHENTRPTRRR